MKIEPGKGSRSVQAGTSGLGGTRLWNAECSIEELPLHRVFWSERICFWQNRDSGEITQIMVRDGFDGAFRGLIRIGSALADVERHVGTWYEELDAYMLDETPGICFELADTIGDEEWIAREQPIEAISVFAQPMTKEQG